MKVVSDKRAKDATEKLQKEKELSKIKVSKDDVDLIVSIFFMVVSQFIVQTAHVVIIYNFVVGFNNNKIAVAFSQHHLISTENMQNFSLNYMTIRIFRCSNLVRINIFSLTFVSKGSVRIRQGVHLVLFTLSGVDCIVFRLHRKVMQDWNVWILMYNIKILFLFANLGTRNGNF